MKWFRHDSAASLDAKLARVRLKYGMEGYGLYWFCLESIARNVESHNLTFVLEEDAELLSVATNIHYERVQEMMTYMVNLGLFENCDGRITCLKMATRTDEYTQKLIRNLPSVPTISRQTPDKIPPIRREEKRREENILGAKRASQAPNEFKLNEAMIIWIKKEGLMEAVCLSEVERFLDYHRAKGSVLKSWDAAFRTWMRNWKKWSVEKRKDEGRASVFAGAK